LCADASLVNMIPPYQFRSGPSVMPIRSNNDSPTLATLGSCATAFRSA
jgi:hypothetical protein